MTLTASPDAKARIQNLSQKELQAFIDEVPPSAMRPIASYLPRVDGFRPGSPAGIVRQKETLARRLTRSLANERDFNALYMVWRAWIDGTQEGAPLIQTLIDEIEEAADAESDPESRKRTIEQRTDALLEKLKAESHQNRSTREKIERLYTFSPLPETATAREIIAAAKNAADIEREAAFHNLPRRLDQSEQELRTQKSELNDLLRRVTAISEDLSGVLGELPALRDAIREAKSSADAAKISFNEKTQIKSAPEGNEAEHPASESHIKTLTDDVNALRDSVEDLDLRFGKLDSTEHAVTELIEKQTQLNTNQLQHANQVEQLTTDLDILRADVDAILDDRTQADRIGPLADQISELSQRISALALHPPAVQPQDQRLPPSNATGLLLQTVPSPIAANANAISSGEELVTAFVNCLLSIGLRKSSAQLFAEECGAAVTARQAILLQGVFASRVARLLAAVVGGDTCARLAVPIGLQDGAQLGRTIDAAFAFLKDGVGGLVIEGLNHAPLDITREVISACTEPDAASNVAHRRIVVFATLSRGLASLGIEPEALELGPVFNLDYLQWRTNPPEVVAPKATFLSIKTDQSLFAQLSSTSASSEEVVHLAQTLTPKRNPAIERNVVRAYQALNLLRSDQQTVTPLHSLFYGWLLPYWRALNLSREQVDNEFDGGKVNGASADARLTAMFDAEFPVAAESGAS
jgi:predicted  nucleic acid-binding Zn-ribbon protein